MTYLDWMKFAIQILSGLIVLIPLVAKLVEVVKQLIEEKNWNELLKNVLSLMGEAEKLFTNGSDKKAWVLEQIEECAEALNFDYDEAAKAKVSELIDTICDTSKVIGKKG